MTKWRVGWLLGTLMGLSSVLCGCTIIHIHVGDTEALVEAQDVLNPSVRIPLPLPSLTGSPELQKE
jgi:hypothetical protein